MAAALRALADVVAALCEGGATAPPKAGEEGAREALGGVLPQPGRSPSARSFSLRSGEHGIEYSSRSSTPKTPRSASQEPRSASRDWPDGPPSLGAAAAQLPRSPETRFSSRALAAPSHALSGSGDSDSSSRGTSGHSSGATLYESMPPGNAAVHLRAAQLREALAGAAPEAPGGVSPAAGVRPRRAAVRAEAPTSDEGGRCAAGQGGAGQVDVTRGSPRSPWDDAPAAAPRAGPPRSEQDSERGETPEAPRRPGAPAELEASPQACAAAGAEAPSRGEEQARLLGIDGDAPAAEGGGAPGKVEGDGSRGPSLDLPDMVASSRA